MQRKLTPQEAWSDFAFWCKIPKNWKGISRAGRDQIGKAIAAAEKDMLGMGRVISLIQRYGPDHYEYHHGEPYFLVRE